METISGCRLLKVYLKAKIYIYVNSPTQMCPNKIIKIFLIEDFSICHRCQRHQWCTFSHEYLPEFSKKIKMAIMAYSVTWGKLIHEKNQKSKISCPRGVPRGDAQDARASPLPPCASPPPAMCIPPSPG
jgi:hypothetical protein